MPGETFDPNQDMAQALMGDSNVGQPAVMQPSPDQGSSQPNPSSIPSVQPGSSGQPGPQAEGFGFGGPQSTPADANTNPVGNPLRSIYGLSPDQVYSGLYVDQSDPYGKLSARAYANALSKYANTPNGWNITQTVDGTLSGVGQAYVMNNHVHYDPSNLYQANQAQNIRGDQGGDGGGSPGEPLGSNYRIGGVDPFAGRNFSHTRQPGALQAMLLPAAIRHMYNDRSGIGESGKAFPGSIQFAPPVNVMPAYGAPIAQMHDPWGRFTGTGDPFGG